MEVIFLNTVRTNRGTIWAERKCPAFYAFRYSQQFIAKSSVRTSCRDEVFLSVSTEECIHFSKSMEAIVSIRSIPIFSITPFNRIVSTSKFEYGTRILISSQFPWLYTFSIRYNIRCDSWQFVCRIPLLICLFLLSTFAFFLINNFFSFFSTWDPRTRPTARRRYD